jgi:hypothetical protein
VRVRSINRFGLPCRCRYWKAIASGGGSGYVLLMQISRTILTLCAAVIGIFPIALQATDTDAQIKARKALEEKMKELQQQPAAPAAPMTPEEKTRAAMREKMGTTPSQPSEPAPKPRTPTVARPAMTPRPLPPSQQPRPVLPPQPAQVQPAPIAAEASPKVTIDAPPIESSPRPVLNAPPSSNPETIAKAREMMRQQMNQLESSHPSAAEPIATSTEPSIARTESAKPKGTRGTSAKPAPTFQAPPEVNSSAAQPVTPPAARQQQFATSAAAQNDTRPSAEQAAEAAAMNKSQKAAAVKKQKTPTTKGTPVFQPMEGPPLPISVDKQQRLAELLRAYQTDLVTPDQYHQQRAKILAEP